MLHHLSIVVMDLLRATTFYDAVLTPLGYERVFTGNAAVGYGYAGHDDLLLLDLQDTVTIPDEGF